MYRWFLLAEVLKRFNWREPVLRVPREEWLCCGPVLLLRGALEGEGHPPAPAVAGLSAIATVALRLGCRAAYVPTRTDFAAVNEERNRAKIGAIQRATERHGTVQLIAETGSSFLRVVRPFFSSLRQFLVERGKLQIVLANPSFVEAHGISAAYLEQKQLSAGIHPRFAQKHREAFVDGLAELTNVGNVELRLAHYGLSATLLITDEVIFYEPYFRNDRRLREKEMLFDTFELRLEADPGSRIREIVKEHFDFFWTHADTPQKFASLGPEYRRILDELMRLWCV